MTPCVAIPCASAATRYFAVTRAMLSDAPLARSAAAASAVSSAIGMSAMRQRYFLLPLQHRADDAALDALRRAVDGRGIGRTQEHHLIGDLFGGGETL